MSKKVKCIECENMMFFAIPRYVNEKNYEYAKHCLKIANRYCVCGYTDKTKPLDNEQYCKHFEERTCNYSNKERIKKLEEAILEYEKQLTSD